jgi:hypothetical protein
MTNKANVAEEVDKATDASGADEAEGYGSDEADVMDNPGEAKVHEAEEAKAYEADEPMNGQNKVKANEACVAIMPAEVDEADAEANEANKVIVIDKAIAADDTDETNNVIVAN